MKKILLPILFLLYSVGLKAQTLAEWTVQNKTAIRYLAEQIAAYAVLLGKEREGYGLQQKGTDTIGRSQGGEWSLHRDFFSSLKAVSPSVRRHTKVAALTAMGLRIAGKTKKSMAELVVSSHFTGREKACLLNVLRGILSHTEDVLNELAAVIFSAAWTMKDDERMQRVECLHTALQKIETDLNNLLGCARGLLLSRQYQQAQIELSKSLNGVK